MADVSGAGVGAADDYMTDYPGAHTYSFKTERLLLRPLRLDDVQSIHALKSDPKVYYWTDVYTEEAQSRQWIEDRLKTERYFSFCVEELVDSEDAGKKTASQRVIGAVGGTDLPEIGYMFRPSVWGRGYATEALQGFINFYWKTFPLGHPRIGDGDERKYLKAVTGPPEEAAQAAASVAVLKKCGFEYWKDQVEDDTVSPEQQVTLSVWRRWDPWQKP
ncbi:MAG: hypothetical protein Q9220_005726 [cf. Caloplaca sp. 1 TL-2023]